MTEIVRYRFGYFFPKELVVSVDWETKNYKYELVNV